jgi:hypothetical protein
MRFAEIKLEDEGEQAPSHFIRRFTGEFIYE